jgi:purine-binding chemotaxis protein CheW
VPAWIAGVVNWRGRVLPVVNLHSVLGADNFAFRPATRLVVLVTDVATVGLLVDAVEGTASLGSLGAPVPLLLSGPGADLVRGQVALDDGPVAVLDVDAVLHLREGLPRGRRRA